MNRLQRSTRSGRLNRLARRTVRSARLGFRLGFRLAEPAARLAVVPVR